MSKSATIKDCPIIVEYMASRLKAVQETANIIGKDFTLSEQLEIVSFFMTLTDEELGLVNKYAYLMRGA